MAAYVTDIGKARLAAAAAGGDPVSLAAGAVGDGGGAPIVVSPAMTALVNQVWSAPLSSAAPDPEDPSTVLVEFVVPAAAGGWWVRELGVFADDGALIVVADFPETYKPGLTEGVGVNLSVVIPVPVSDASEVVLTVEPSAVYVTRLALDADLAGLEADLEAEIAAHAGRADNPHEVSCGQIGAAAAGHGHAIADITNLQTALDGKAPATHGHAIADVTNLQASLDGKASTTHTQAISTVTNLQTTLDGKAAASHGHAIADVTNLQASLDGKAAASHTHDDRYFTETEADGRFARSLSVNGNNLELKTQTGTLLNSVTAPYATSAGTAAVATTARYA